ncbi:methylated-DNA--[protein]-cysteine S-methyltransferase (plasmid) [Azospirillum humicireducens]|uniref:Methylated-DNA--protein-cysteine methyltransferase n=1 Tax=Azospirillum humicireducens TaxID=1226968 RepID=A0A2R4VV39_9PROT|nr:methylated-DNA--[protein]-cysteine S-methyltransferase [Azospirillum humicireducens]AWB08282.1 methylated-DNA--[protein]-cysteine S-methyltransferase [Azospirillum humicireducens]
MPAVSSLLIDRTATPIGELILVADTDGALHAIDWTDHEERLHRLLCLHHRSGYELRQTADPGGLTRAMDAYFAGELSAIDRLPVRTGGTPFQRAVWAALRGIPCGVTITYRELAVLAGRPAAVRAAGHANGANPVGIVVPCHRVIGSDGTLTGYGGGVERKRWLLTHEGAAVR